MSKRLIKKSDSSYNNLEEISLTGSIYQNFISRFNRSPSMFIKIETEYFLRNLGIEYSDGKILSSIYEDPLIGGLAEVHGWQIIPNKTKDQLHFRYAPVLKDGRKLDEIIMKKEYYVMIECADKISRLNYPLFGQPIEEKYAGETSIEEIHEKGRIPKDFLKSSQKIDFFYLVKEDLDFMLTSKPLLLYISKCNLGYEGGIDMEDGQDFVMLKIECSREYGPIFIHKTDSKDSESKPKMNKSEIPLYILASPCPPKWNPNSDNGGPGTEIFFGTSTEIKNRSTRSF